MRWKIMDVKNKTPRLQLVEFNSLSEFYDYITNTPLNETFKHESLASINGTRSFTQTENFEEAVELFKRGWEDMSEKLTQSLKIEDSKMKMERTMVSRNVVGVQGYQPIVPLYLNGIPANMVSRKMQPVKQKVITLNKSICYSACVSTNEIIRESVKALTLIKKLERQSYRCNLNIIVGLFTSEKSYMIRIRIKSANERLNINKLSFPLVHPSMLRRLFFRFIEVHPGIPRNFIPGYGRPIEPAILRTHYPDEILLPQFINKDINSINSLEDLENI